MKTETSTHFAKQVVCDWIFLLFGFFGLCATAICLWFGFFGPWDKLGAGLVNLMFFFLGALLLASYEGPDDPDPMEH